MKTMEVSTRNHNTNRSTRYGSTSGIDIDSLSIENRNKIREKKKKLTIKFAE